MSGTLTRSTINTEQYAAPEFQKSGFPLGYSRHDSHMLGRLEVGAYHHCMPGDKISGQNSFDGTFNNIVTPMISPVRAMSYNFFLPYRAVDNTFYKGMVPTKLNSMSANWSTPKFNTRYLIDKLFRSYFADWQERYSGEGSTIDDILNIIADQIGQCAANPSYTLHDAFEDWFLDPDDSTQYGDFYSWFYGGKVENDPNVPVVTGVLDFILKSLLDSSSAAGSLYHQAEQLYLCDALIDIADNIKVKLGTADNPLPGSTTLRDFCRLLLDCLLTPFVGRYSYYAQFKYPYVRPLDIEKIITDKVVAHDINTWTKFLALFTDEDKNEYAIRIMYAIWYDRFRNVDLEPVSSSLPDFRDFGSTSIFDMSNGGNLCYLIFRIRSWEKDMYTTAQIDDISRHVYAPIYASSSSLVAGHTAEHNNRATNNPDDPTDVSNGGAKPASYDITYLDQLSGNSTTVTCPVPANINDMLSSLDMTSVDVYGLDLNTLRQSQMLERYLKRNYLFGDEYQDRLLAHYNSRLSDMRINRPELLSQAIDDMNAGQEIANMSNGISNAGDRTATATIKLSGDLFTTYCEEFGMVVTLLTFMPRPMYDGDDAHNSLTKQVHFPLPEFAANNEEFGRKSEISGSALNPTLEGDDADTRFMFGRYPAYHIWRSRVDEVGGMFLNELQDATFRRFWGNYSNETTPKLNYFFIHCRPNLQMFRNSNLYDCQLYGTLVNECFVERVLPTPVETI